MGRFDKLKEYANKASETIKKGTTTLSDSVKKVDLGDLSNQLKEKASSMKETAQNFDAKEATKDAISKAAKLAEKMTTFTKHSKETDQAVKNALNEAQDEEILLSEEDALKIAYLMMQADRFVTSDEEDKFMSICADLNVEKEKTTEIVSYCDSVTSGIGDEDYMDAIRDGIRDLIKDRVGKKNGTVNGKLLIWDLLAIAYSDGEYSKEEEKIIRQTSTLVGIDKSVLPEFISSIHTIMAIDKEVAWLKQTDRKFVEIENELNELDDRKKNVLQGVYCLISD